MPKIGTPDQEDLDAALRRLVTKVIRRCPLSREQIAEAMIRLTGQRVTVFMLNGYTSRYRRQSRFPLAFTPAFCHVLGNYELLDFIVREVGKLRGLEKSQRRRTGEK